MTEDAGLLAAWLARMADIGPELWRATLETLYMVAASTVFSFAVGFVLAVFMILTHPGGIRPWPKVYRPLDAVINLGRSFPFIILLITIQPLTRLVVGSTLGSTAAVVPLTLGAAPLVARIIEGSFLEVDAGVVEAARSFGAGDMQIIWRVLVNEALPSIVLNVAVIAITLVGYSAMAGAVGGGGLGNMAMSYGYYRFQADVIFYCVVILLLLVQGIQSAVGFAYTRLR